MPPRIRRDLAVPQKAFLYNPELVRIVPVSPPRHVRGRENFNLESELMVGYKVGSIMDRENPSDGLRRRDTINPKTAAKWRKRQSVQDRKTEPRKPRLTVHSEEDQAVTVIFRRHSLLPLDDCLYALRPTIPHLTRLALHRCLQRHGISRLPDMDTDKPSRSPS